MAKVLTDKELALIVSRTVNGDEFMICERGVYRQFVEGLAELVAYYGGAELVGMSDAGEESNRRSPFLEDRVCAHFDANECTPSDGGVFKEYGTGEDMADWLGGGLMNDENKARVIADWVKNTEEKQP
jgi:hypothetical protein